MTLWMRFSRSSVWVSKKNNIFHIRNFKAPGTNISSRDVSAHIDRGTDFLLKPQHKKRKKCRLYNDEDFSHHAQCVRSIETFLVFHNSYIEEQSL